MQCYLQCYMLCYMLSQFDLVDYYCWTSSCEQFFNILNLLRTRRKKINEKSRLSSIDSDFFVDICFKFFNQDPWKSRALLINGRKKDRSVNLISQNVLNGKIDIELEFLQQLRSVFPIILFNFVQQWSELFQGHLHNVIMSTVELTFK